MLALEREEHAFARLVRGLVSRTGLMAEKVAAVALAARRRVTLVMTAGVSLFVTLDWSRFAAVGGRAAWPAAWPSARSAWRSARWRARSAPRRCWRSCSRCRSPSSRWCRRARWPTGLYDAIRVVSALFPFRAALDAVDAALNDAGGLGGALAHLAALVVGWSVRRARARASLARSAAIPRATFAAVLGHVPPRIRLDAEHTAIRPLAVDDATEFAAAVVANRAHTRRGSRSTPRRTTRAPGSWRRCGATSRLGARDGLRVRGAGPRRTATRSSGASRWATSCAARGATRRSATGSTAAAGGRGHATAAARADLRVRLRPRRPAPRAAGRDPAQRPLDPRRREGGLPARGPGAASTSTSPAAGRTTTSSR